MTTNNRSEIHVDAKVTAEYGVIGYPESDILNTWPHSIVLACPLCRFVGSFSRRLVRQTKRRVVRKFECPACMCTITVTIRV